MPFQWPQRPNFSGRPGQRHDQGRVVVVPVTEGQLARRGGRGQGQGTRGRQGFLSRLTRPALPGPPIPPGRGEALQVHVSHLEGPAFLVEAFPRRRAQDLEDLGRHPHLFLGELVMAVGVEDQLRGGAAVAVGPGDELAGGADVAGGVQVDPEVVAGQRPRPGGAGRPGGRSQEQESEDDAVHRDGVFRHAGSSSDRGGSEPDNSRKGAKPQRKTGARPTSVCTHDRLAVLCAFA
jgi:hypothetical protein